jgi:hypothetical protein
MSNPKKIFDNAGIVLLFSSDCTLQTSTYKLQTNDMAGTIQSISDIHHLDIRQAIGGLVAI